MNTMIATAYPPLRETLERFRAGLDRIPFSIVQLGARVAAGSIFFHSGLTKIHSWPSTVALFRDEYALPVIPPEQAAALGATFELLCPVFLVLGLGSRLAVLPLLGMTAIIQLFVYPEDWTDHLTWAVLLTLVLIRGPGALSIDHWWWSRVSRTR
jgi:putative oxidoreductase